MNAHEFAAQFDALVALKTAPTSLSYSNALRADYGINVLESRSSVETRKSTTGSGDETSPTPYSEVDAVEDEGWQEENDVEVSINSSRTSAAGLVCVEFLPQFGVFTVKRKRYNFLEDTLLKLKHPREPKTNPDRKQLVWEKR
jgi:hypothetical protein